MVEPEALVAGGAGHWGVALTIEVLRATVVIAVASVRITIMVVGTIAASAVGLEARIVAMVVRSSATGSQIAVITTIGAATNQSAQPSTATAFDRIARTDFAFTRILSCTGPGCCDPARSQS